MGDLKGMIRNIGLAVIFSLLCVAGNSMAMSLRERTTEVAVLKAIGAKKSPTALEEDGIPGERVAYFDPTPLLNQFNSVSA